jgi:hypothetical protein
MQVSVNRLKLQDLAISLIDSLEQLEVLVKDRQYDLDAPKLRSALSSLDWFVSLSPFHLVQT